MAFHSTENRGLSQEALKLIACVTMLIDHIGATLVLHLVQNAADHAQWQELVRVYYAMRIIGRIAFPIYGFLLVEGAHHTRSPRKYGIRLAIGAALSELPFRLAFQTEGCSVMVTLLLGFCMIQGMDRVKGFWKLVMILPFFLAAEFLGTDYTGNGIAVIAMLALTRGVKYEKFLRFLGFGILFTFGAPISIGGVNVPIEVFAIPSLIAIFCYGGHKLTHSKAVQWAFYLFYPVHLTVLWVLDMLLFG